MLRSSNELKGYSIAATDGDIGEVVEFYFDDEKWTVRYLVVDTGTWLPGRKVLISPVAFGKVDWERKRVNVALTKQQVENSPDIDTNKPVSRQQETTYYNYYQYPFYWTGPYLWGPAAFPRGVVVPQTVGGETTQAREIRERQRESEDTHLRSTREVTGYYIEAADGDIGHVEDFLIDDESWNIRYVVVDTRNWLPGKNVLVAPEWIKNVGWTDSRVYVDLTRSAIQNSPEYDPAQTVNRDYEGRLYRHYGRSEYWRH